MAGRGRSVKIRGVLGGLFLGIGLALVAQQSAMIDPTLVMLIIFLVGGLVVGIGLPLLIGTLAGRGSPAVARASSSATSRSSTASSSTAGATVAEEPSPSVGVPGWRLTHVVGAGGARAWTGTDISGPPIAELAEGVELQVTEEAGDLVKVAGANGWTGWVERSSLQAR